MAVERSKKSGNGHRMRYIDAFWLFSKKIENFGAVPGHFHSNIVQYYVTGRVMTAVDSVR